MEAHIQINVCYATPRTSMCKSNTLFADFFLFSATFPVTLFPRFGYDCNELHFQIERWWERRSFVRPNNSLGQGINDDDDESSNFFKRIKACRIT